MYRPMLIMNTYDFQVTHQPNVHTHVHEYYAIEQATKHKSVHAILGAKD